MTEMNADDQNAILCHETTAIENKPVRWSKLQLKRFHN